MIEPTGEMRLAFDEAPGADKGCHCAICLNHRLAAVLATVERDYELISRGTPGSQCRCDLRPRPLHELGSPGCYAHVEPGMCRCRPGEGQHEFGVEGCQGFDS